MGKRGDNKAGEKRGRSRRSDGMKRSMMGGEKRREEGGRGGARGEKGGRERAGWEKERIEVKRKKLRGG